jgi:predicted ester cyclase
MSERADFNRELGLKINREIWNEGRLERIADYFAEDFVADRTPYGVIKGLTELRQSVERSHAAFSGFAEKVKTVVADDDRVVVHFTITGRHTGQWGPLAPTGREVAFDEIVIMTVRNGKVARLSGVIDNLTGLRQVGALPTPARQDSRDACEGYAPQRGRGALSVPPQKR